jgi:hypothetical protein
MSRTGGFGYPVSWSLPCQPGTVRVLSRREMSAMAEDGELGELDRPADGENNGPNPVHPLGTGDGWLLGVAPGGFGNSPVISEPKASTPLESARPDPVIPSSPLWAMKYLRHARLGRSPDREFDQIRWASADDERGAIVYAIDDGDDHCMVARLVGVSADGCTYCLVARVKRLDFEDVRAGWAQSVDLFSRGKEFTLCGVVEGALSNVVRVAEYRKYKDVPIDYLPPASFIVFDRPL